VDLDEALDGQHERAPGQDERPKAGKSEYRGTDPQVSRKREESGKPVYHSINRGGIELSMIIQFEYNF
jgi:hypothetical protein